MIATADRHLPEEAATRIVPAVAPLAIDPVPEVELPRLLCTLLASRLACERVLSHHNWLRSASSACAALEIL